MREEMILRCAQTPWALRGQEDLFLALERYLASTPKAVARSPTPTPRGGTVVIPVHGVIGQSSDLADFPDTSVEWLSAAFDAALASPQIGTIVLDVNSPGGSVFGVPELAAKIQAARGQKKVIAVATGVMASAAYWLGSAASEVVLAPSSQAGSIGVWAAHVDASALYDKIGLKFTMVSAGKFKTEGNPYEPLAPEALAAMQGRVDEYYGMFVRGVAEGRRTSMKNVHTNFGEGRMLGADQAVAAGMADRVGTLDATLQRLAGKTGAPAQSLRAQLERRQTLLEAELDIDA